MLDAVPAPPAPPWFDTPFTPTALAPPPPPEALELPKLPVAVPPAYPCIGGPEVPAAPACE